MATNGFYYHIDTGAFIGKVDNGTGDKDAVFACKGKNKDGSFVSPQKISLNHKEFRICATIIAKESGTATDECIYLAFTANNWAKRTKKSVYSLLMSGYSSVAKEQKVPLPDTSSDKQGILARKGLLQSQLGLKDPTGGATHWDGTDFLAWGLKNPQNKEHPKFKQYKKITIKKSLYEYYLKETIKKHPSKQAKYSGKLFFHSCRNILRPKELGNREFCIQYQSSCNCNPNINCCLRQRS